MTSLWALARNKPSSSSDVTTRGGMMEGLTREQVEEEVERIELLAHKHNRETPWETRGVESQR